MKLLVHIKQLPTLGMLLAMALLSSNTAIAQRRPTAPATPQPQQQRTPAAGDKDTTLQTTRLEITQVYVPELKKTPRPTFSPAPPPVDTSRVKYTYAVPQQTLNYTYRSMPLRPLALGADTQAMPPQNYVKLAGGNNTTVLAELGIAALRGSNYGSTLFFDHLSQSSNFDGQQNSTTRVRADGFVKTGGHTIDAGLAVKHNRYRYFGYDHEIFSYDMDTLKQAFTGITVALGAQNDKPVWNGWSYKPTLVLNAYQDKYKATERTLGFNVPFTRDLDEFVQFQIGVDGVIGQYKVGDTISRFNSYFQINPAVRYRQNGFDGTFGLTPSFGHRTWLLPKIIASYKISSTNLSVGAGWVADINTNSYESLSTLNPFISNLYRQEQSRHDEVYGHGKLNFAKYFTVDARLGYHQWTNLPVFLNNYSEIPDGRQFSVVNDGLVNAISFGAGLQYQIGESFLIGGSGTWYNYYKSSYARVWGRPGVQLKANTSIQPIKKLNITAYLAVLDQIYALSKTGTELKMPAYVDLGIGANYQLIPQVNLFLQTTNLLNLKNERWNQYGSYGFTIFGGAAYRF